MDRVVEYFGAVADPRAGNARHDFLEVIFVALAASLCGAEDCTEMALFARAKLEVLRQVVKLDHGAPSHDTFSRVFRMIAPEPFEAAFAAFMKAFGGRCRAWWRSTGRPCGAYARGRRTMPLHLVNIWAAETRLVIGQRLAPGRNEVLGAQQALALLRLDGCIVTADALHCRPDTARAILATGADYALALKANQPTLLARAQALVRDADLATGPPAPAIAHDRRESRSAIVLPADDLDFPGVAAVAMIESRRQPTGQHETHAVRWFLLSTVLSPSACSMSLAPTGPSITSSTGSSMSTSARMPQGPARIMPRRTSPSCANSPSISLDSTLTKDPSRARSSAQGGTMLSYSRYSLICDSPACRGGGSTQC